MRRCLSVAFWIIFIVVMDCGRVSASAQLGNDCRIYDCNFPGLYNPYDGSNGPTAYVECGIPDQGSCSKETCCAECDTYENCPTGTYNAYKAGPITILHQPCCEPLQSCASHSCSNNYLVKKSYNAWCPAPVYIQGSWTGGCANTSEWDDVCCDAITACNGHACSQPLVKKTGVIACPAIIYNGPAQPETGGCSDAVCCEVASDCASFDCSSYDPSHGPWFNPSSFRPATADKCVGGQCTGNVCCRPAPTCGTYLCTSQLVSRNEDYCPAMVYNGPTQPVSGGCTDELCCAPSCNYHSCGQGGINLSGPIVGNIVCPAKVGNRGGCTNLLCCASPCDFTNAVCSEVQCGIEGTMKATNADELCAGATEQACDAVPCDVCPTSCGNGKHRTNTVAWSSTTCGANECCVASAQCSSLEQCDSGFSKEAADTEVCAAKICG
jgi:hypothetical protein